MRIVRYILFSGLFLMLWGLASHAQESQWSACVGDTGVYYRVSGWETSTFEWTIEAGTITRDYGDSIIVDWNVGPGVYIITVQETSENGCPGPVRTAAVEVVAPDVSLGGDDYVCEGGTIELSPGDDYYGYLWHDGSTEASLLTGEEGWVSVEVSDEFGCVASDSVYISVYDLPVVDLGPDTIVCDGEGIDLDAGSDGIDYTWSTGEIGQIITVYNEENQDIWVIVEDEYQCANSDTVLIKACDAEFYLSDIPTAITPGEKDGKNDTWVIEKLTGYSQVEVEIFDRWGTLVWRSEPGYSVPWDGTTMNGKDVPMDSYHYIIKLNTGGKKDVITGAITVIR